MHVGARAFLNRAEGHVATRGAQLREVGLGVGLVLALERLGEGDVLDFACGNGFFEAESGLTLGFAKRIDHGKRHVVEGLGAARTAVVDAGDGLVEEVHEHVHDVVDVDEVAQLGAVVVAEATFEELHFTRATVLEVLVVGDARHAAFVLLVRAVHVEVAQADDGTAQVVHFAAQDLVEEVLRVAVDVERSFVADVFDEFGVRAVRGGRGGVDEGNVELLRPTEEVERVAVVVLHHVDAVLLHRVGAGPLMEDRFGLRCGSGANARDEIPLVEVVRNAALGEIEELFALLEVVDGDHVGDAPSVEGENIVAADEAGCAGHNNTHLLTR